MTRARRRDRNHDEIARALSRVAIVIDTHAAPEVGCDLLVLSRGRTFFVEIKDGEKPPSARQLTPMEANRRAGCIAASVPYVIVRDTAEALCAVCIDLCDEAVVSWFKCQCGTLDGPARFRTRAKGA